MRNQGNYTIAPRPRRSLLFLALLLIVATVTVAMVRTIRLSRVSAMRSALRLNPETGAFGLPDGADINPADTILADVYPSRQSALRALARRLPDALDQVSRKPTRLRLGFEDRPLDGSALYEALRQHFPTIPLAGPADRSPKSAGEVTIALRIDDDPARTPRRAAKGNVQVTIAGADRGTSLSTRFVQCDWAGDLTDYMNEHPGHTWIVARSPKPCLSPAEARRAAEDAAADAVLLILQSRVPISSSPVALQENLTLGLRGDIRGSLPISGRFAQQFHRTYGDVWIESILLDVTPQWIDGVHRRQSGAAGAHRIRTQTAAASMGIVLMAILLAYLFANTITRRYFTGGLRAAAIACALIALTVTIGIISFA